MRSNSYWNWFSRTGVLSATVSYNLHSWGLGLHVYVGPEGAEIELRALCVAGSVGFWWSSRHEITLDLFD